MSVIEEIEAQKQASIELFGEDHAIVRSYEVQERYFEIYQRFGELQDEGVKYEDSILQLTDEFYVSKSTAKRAISSSKSLVHKNELNKEKPTG